MKKIIINLGIISFFVGIVYLGNILNLKELDASEPNSNPVVKQEDVAPKDRKAEMKVEEGSTFGSMMSEAGVDSEAAAGIFEASKKAGYDLSKIRLGRSLYLVFTPENVFKQLEYEINSEDRVIVNRLTGTFGKTSTSTGENLFEAIIKPIDYEIKTRTISGTLESSLYQFALDNNIDEREIIEFASGLEWSIDFASDPRVGDKFKFVIEERYKNGKYIMPGWVLAGAYNNSGKEHNFFYFKESDENKGYFDEQGNSMQKMFLKAPLSFKFISSGFTTGRRYVKAFNTSTGHRAIDYAATYGTPIRSVGDGTVVFAGWAGPYGNKTTIRHNATFSTNYAHQSKFAVSRGQKVKQGQVIGYVGSTGFSTGPHLHFEMVKNGVKINPMNEVLPPGKPIKDENRARFEKEIGRWKEQISRL